MPRRKNVFYEGGYYHVYLRGNEKRNVFIYDEDYAKFLSRIEEYKEIYKISCICYCLMPNHLHLLLRQISDISISQFMHRLLCAYSMYFNKKHNRIGHVFQGRFKAKEVKDDDYLLYISRYIHRNPSDIVDTQEYIENYQWSSYAEYLQKCQRKICDQDIIYKLVHEAGYGVDYQKYVNMPIFDEKYSDINKYLSKLS